MSSPEGNGSREDESNGNRGGGTGELEGVPNTRNKIGSKKNNTHQSKGDGQEPRGVLGDWDRTGEEEAVEVEAKRVENDGEDQHQVDRITYPHNVTDEGTVWDSKVYVEVCQYIVERLLTEEKEPEEASRDIDR